nr:MAG TPA: Cell cycle protein [Caudoviricetes sp.]
MRYEILEKLDQFFSVKEHLERLDESLKDLKDERKRSLETLERLTNELKEVLKKERECE